MTGAHSHWRHASSVLSIADTCCLKRGFVFIEHPLIASVVTCRYYQWQMKPHRIVTATATGNRLFLLALQANSRQFRKSSQNLGTIADSFFVPPAKNYNTGF